MKKIRKDATLNRYNLIAIISSISLLKTVQHLLQCNLSPNTLQQCCNTMLIHHGDMVKLRGADIVHYFNEKRVLTPWTFHYLLTCIRHDDIVHKCHTRFLRLKSDTHRMYVQDQFIIHTTKM
jgi:hypothetical protein